MSVNALLRSFQKENSKQALMYYQLADPTSIFISKYLFNTIYIIFLGLLSYGALSIISINPVKDYFLFLTCIVLGSFGISAVFTFVAAISAKAGNAQLLTAVLGFPCILPVLLVVLKLSANALRLINDTDYITDIYILLAIDTLIVSVTTILFPYLWRE